MSKSFQSVQNSELSFLFVERSKSNLRKRIEIILMMMIIPVNLAHIIMY